MYVPKLFYKLFLIVLKQLMIIQLCLYHLDLQEELVILDVHVEQF